MCHTKFFLHFDAVIKRMLEFIHDEQPPNTYFDGRFLPRGNSGDDSIGISDELVSSCDA